MRRRISSLRYPTRTLRRLIMQCQCHHSSTLLLSSGAAALGSPFNISQEDSCFGRWLACDSARLCCGSGCPSPMSSLVYFARTRLCCGSGCPSWMQLSSAWLLPLESLFWSDEGIKMWVVSAACTFTYQHRLLNYYTLNHLWHPQKRCDFGAAHYRFVPMLGDLQ